MAPPSRDCDGPRSPPPGEHDVTFLLADTVLHGTLLLPKEPQGITLVISAMSHDRRDTCVRSLGRTVSGGLFATLLLNLLTAREMLARGGAAPSRCPTLLLAARINSVLDALLHSRALTSPRSRASGVGLLGLNGANAATLAAAAARPDRAGAVVTLGGPPDIAAPELGQTCAPTLLLAGGAALGTVFANRRALAHLGSSAKRLVILPGVGEILADRAALGAAARHAHRWFLRYLGMAILRGGRG